MHGLLHALRRDWHIRFICLIGAAVMLASALLRATRVEVLLLCVAICLVVLAEIFNRAIEAVVDLSSPDFHPLAKVAKDVGGAGVLAATIFAAVIAAGVFVNEETLEMVQGIRARPAPGFLHVGLVGVATVAVAVILGKLWGGHGTLTRGGVVSAHSALAFFCFISIWFHTTDLIVRGFSFALAVMVAQSRVDAGIHTVREVLIGLLVALVTGTGLYGVLGTGGG